MIAHDCTRQVELLSFIECESATAKAGWMLDTFFRDRRTKADKLAVRNYSQASSLPLLYTGACVPPNLIDGPVESMTLQELNFPVIKAEIAITGCDVEQRIINNDGTITLPGVERFNNALMWGMKGLIDGLRATHAAEATTLLRTGGYVMNAKSGTGGYVPMGTIDFGRRTLLTGIDLVGTDNAWSNPCAKPFEVIQNVLSEMARCGGVAGATDIIYSAEAHRALQAHQEREVIQNGGLAANRFDVSTSLLSNSLTMMIGYNDVFFLGTTNGGQLRHWLSNAVYMDHTGAEAPAVRPGEIMIVNGGAFDGQRVYKTITSDSREELPEGSLPFFLYDDLNQEYKPKCRSFNPWLEEYHILVPGNVNGATVVRVVDPAIEICVPCEVCI